MIKRVFLAIHYLLAVGVLLFGGLFGYLHFNGTSPTKSMYSHAEIMKIQPDLIVDEYALVNPDVYAEEIVSFNQKLISKGILLMTPFGYAVNPSVDRANTQVEVIIQSPGGSVGMGLSLIGLLDTIRQGGVSVICHVGEAQSMAFSILVLGCDKVIAKKVAVLMQHRTSYYGLGATPSTYVLDLELVKLESDALGVSFAEWYNLTRRESSDHIFTRAEIDKYKLVDEWVD